MRHVLLALSLALLSSGPLWAQEATISQPEATYTLYAPELMQLLSISARLKALSVSLSDKLMASQLNLKTQESELKALRQELEDLKLTTEQSGTQLDQLKAMLKESESSLTRLTLSFDEYKNEAQKTIRNWRIVAIGSIVAGITIAIIF